MFSPLQRQFTRAFLVLLMAIPAALFAQEPAFVPGEILFQTKAGHNGAQVVRELAVELGPTADLAIERNISASMRIWHVRFDGDAWSQQLMLEQFRKHPAVAVAQSNHIIKKRATTPNDAQFGSQWQYINTGANGGLVGADLDVDLAWDFATGGVTALGDTIVVCVIDDAPDLNHEDLAPNMWRNHAEIPNNGIDDDNNGFTDDVLGWDAYDNDGDVSVGFSSHGTSVAGIMGAKGNNGIGVSGISWDVKIMAVVGGGDEADALAAYAYPLALRKQWNQSGGTQGAFVVATNASWGVNFGDPNDAPLWCAMYDTLGHYGILNCGATINGNTNVDVDGDLPTACPSDFLISVTNVDNTDTKVNSAGYGATTIDLGAFGEDTYTTENNNQYGGFGGTSGATPHVTGTIGLLYSAPCENLMAIANVAPDSVARLMKQFILDGADPNTSLQGITVTGGRLNVNGAMQQLLQFDCASSACFEAFNLGTANLTDAQATLQWNALNSANYFTVEYRPVAASSWTSDTTSATSYAISGLTACTDYVFRVEAVCDTSSASWSNEFSFTTDGCCEAPHSTDVGAIGGTTAEISWSSVLAAGAYTIRFRPVGIATWTEISGIAATSQSLSGLETCTEYEVQLASECDGGTTDFGPLATFSTIGCQGCKQPYCASFGGNVDSEWIAAVELAGLQHFSSSDGGYADYTGTPEAILVIDSNFTLQVTAGYSGQQFNEDFIAWIDWNQDGDFLDANEKVLEASGSGTVGQQFDVPIDADTGITRMRVSMSFQGEQSPCEEDFNWGEVEDYCVLVRLDAPATVAYKRATLALSVFPNPSAGTFNVQWAGEQLATATLVNVLGQPVWSGQLKPGVQQLEADQLARGAYFLQVRTPAGIVVKQLLVE